MDGFRNMVHSTYKAVAEKVMPVATKSEFQEKGVLTPVEFVAAGDYLIRTCPTWSWGDAQKRAEHLPANKQFLITRNVPCLRRAAAVEEYGHRQETVVEQDLGDGEGWVTADAGRSAAGVSAAEAAGFEEIPSAAEAAGGGGKGPSGGAGAAAQEELEDVGATGDAVGAEGGDDDDDVPDIADLCLEEAEEDEAALPSTSAAAAAGAANDAIVRTRTYDLHITYDYYYRVPRFWLIGYDEDRQPLTEAQVKEDVSAEHVGKTITWDPHPHSTSGMRAASIHPCKHAEVMHKLSGVVAGEGAEFRVDHYMVLFLKFIASVVPTIDYDHTMQAGSA